MCSLPDMSWRHTCMCAASFWFYIKSGGELKQNITMKRHAYSYINTKFRTHLKRVHSGHYSGNLCQKLPGDEFPAEIWQITGTGSIGYELIPKTSFWFWEWGSRSMCSQLIQKQQQHTGYSAIIKRYARPPRGLLHVGRLLDAPYTLCCYFWDALTACRLFI